MHITPNCSFEKVLSILSNIHSVFKRNREKGIPDAMTFYWLEIPIFIDGKEALETVLDRLNQAFDKIFEDIAEFFREQQGATA